MDTNSCKSLARAPARACELSELSELSPQRPKDQTTMTVRDIQVPANGYTPSPPAWYCHECGRMEDDAGKYCPDCNGKRQRVSRYEWFLADALDTALEALGRDFCIEEQWRLKDHRGFDWHFDLAVKCKGTSVFGGITCLIEVNGSDHDRQKPYSGAGGGYTRDFDKHWEAFSNRRLHKQGYEYLTVTNDECKRRVVNETAMKLAVDIARMADTWS